MLKSKKLTIVGTDKANKFEAWISQVFLRPLLEPVEASDAKMGPTCASSLSQSMHSSERVKLKVGAEARSSLVLHAVPYRASCAPWTGIAAGYSIPSSGQV